MPLDLHDIVTGTVYQGLVSEHGPCAARVAMSEMDRVHTHIGTRPTAKHLCEGCGRCLLGSPRRLSRNCARDAHQVHNTVLRMHNAQMLGVPALREADAPRQTESCRYCVDDIDIRTWPPAAFATVLSTIPLAPVLSMCPAGR